MPPEAWIALAFGVVIALVGFIWRDLVKRVERIDSKVDSTPQAVLAEKVTRLLSDYYLLHEWKRTLLPNDLNNRAANIRERIDRIETALTKRIERIETVLNGRLK